jgi:UPF0716 protein FxsA
MALLLVLVFFVAPLAELAVIVQVAGTIGVLDTIALLVAVSVLGAWLARREGLGVVRRIQAALDRGQMPSTEVADGGLILFAGVLMIAPGFISDALAILLLLPPTRALVRGPVMRYVSRRSRAAVTSRARYRWADEGFGRGAGGNSRGNGGGDADIWDVDSWEEPPAPRTRGELGDPS